MIKIVHNKLLKGWFVVRGPHQTPLSGRFNSRAEALASLEAHKYQPKIVIDAITNALPKRNS